MFNTPGSFWRGQTGAFFLVNGFTSLAFSFMLPIMTLFLVDSLHTPPMYIGIYTTGTALMTVLISQILAGLTDKGVSAKGLFLFAVAGIAAAAIGFAFASAFWHALLTGMLLMSLGSSSMPLILGMIRRYAEDSGRDATKLNSQMRSSVSLLWIFGPPIAFLSVDSVGYKMNFLLSATVAILVFLFAYYALNAPKTHHRRVKHITGTEKQKLPREVWILAGAMFFASAANSTYVNAMPLYITQQLGLSESFPGLMLGLAAGLEVPVMLLAAHWSKKFGSINVLIVGFVVALLFYALFQVVTSYAGLLALQLLNGLFFGIFVGLGVSVMQDYAPGQVGKASAFYSNSMLIGSMCGTSLMGIVSQYFGYKHSLYTCMFCVVCATAILIYFGRRVRQHGALRFAHHTSS